MLGVCGGISAYKSVELLRLLTKAGAHVDVVMTEYATRFVGVATMKGLSGRPVLQDLYNLPAGFSGESLIMPHLEIAEGADLALIVPATANTIAKLVIGLADNALMTTLLSVRAPLIVAPAMDSDMWSHPATQSNIELLKSRGVYIVGPVVGELARGNVGAGRLIEPTDIFRFAQNFISGTSAHDGEFNDITEGKLAGKHIVVTAGGTREPIDPVRFLTNRSSGKMGIAVASAAIDSGANVTLIHAPTAEKLPEDCHLVPVETAEEMHQEVMDRASSTDVLIMAAAVSDYRVRDVAYQKVKKEKGENIHLTLVPNPDIAAHFGKERRDDQLLVIFAAETENLTGNAGKKLRSKNAHIVVANDVSRSHSGFDVDTNEVVFLFADGTEEKLPILSKKEVGTRLIAHVVDLIG